MTRVENTKAEVETIRTVSLPEIIPASIENATAPNVISTTLNDNLYCRIRFTANVKGTKYTAPIIELAVNPAIITPNSPLNNAYAFSATIRIPINGYIDPLTVCCNHGLLLS
jgi:hypothetical protein